MKKIIVLLTLIVCFGSCKKQEEIGPDINAIYGPVTITQPFSVSATSIDFSTGSKLFFNASFQNDASWIITIKGATSNAIKTICGIGKTINVSNSTWDGSADSPPSFSLETVSNDEGKDYYEIEILECGAGRKPCTDRDECLARTECSARESVALRV